VKNYKKYTLIDIARNKYNSIFLNIVDLLLSKKFVIIIEAGKTR